MSDLYIMHYGVGHDKGGHSGRYPWGSGDEPYQDLSAAERRQKRLDKYWYHKGAKTRIGVDHIRDVDPNTKLSDLFKYNKRTTSDVLADKILTFMYGDTEMDREELRRKKYNLMSAITAAEAVAATSVLIGGLSSIKTGMNFATKMLDHKIAVDSGIRQMNEGIERAQAGFRRGVLKEAKDTVQKQYDFRGGVLSGAKNAANVSGAREAAGKQWLANNVVNPNIMRDAKAFANSRSGINKTLQSQNQSQTQRALNEFILSHLNDPRAIEEATERANRSTFRDPNKLF